jgi:chloride channel protein, CIC family
VRLRTALGVISRLAAAGMIAGALAVGLEWWVVEVTTPELAEHRAWIPIALGTGLVVVQAIGRLTKADAALTDDIVTELGGGGSPAGRVTIARAFMTAITLGVGVPLGIEGPAVAFGGTVGGRLGRWGAPHITRWCVVAGAAGAMGGVMRAPIAGALFAIELPYRRGARWRDLPIALIGGTMGSVVAWFRHGDITRFDVGSVPLSTRGLVASIAVGVAVVLVVRAFVVALRWATTRAAGLRVVGIAVVVATAIVAAELASSQVSISPGAEIFELSRDPAVAIGTVAALLALRFAGVVAAVGARAVGGLTVPLLILGALTGRIVADSFDAPVVAVLFAGAMAAFACGFRVPYAALALAFETTHSVTVFAAAAIAISVVAIAMGDPVVTTQAPRVDRNEVSGATRR